MREKDIISKYFSPLTQGAIGADNLNDDIAVLGNLGNGLLAINMDTLVANTHFFPNDDPVVLAQKALRVNISDLAAKGATPFGYFLSLSLPIGTGEQFIKDFTRGLSIDQRNFGINLLGGDTVKTDGSLTITITVLGLLEKSYIPRRSGAQIGDDIYVTGTIGDGGLGLLSHPDYSGKDQILSPYSRHLSHYLCPEPRVELKPIITQFANASMDISDGLLGDLSSLIEKSGIGADINIDHIPHSEETALLLRGNVKLKSIMLNGGDDYEILFTANNKNFDAIKNLSEHLPFRLTKIGKITKATGLKLFEFGKITNLKFMSSGHNHVW